MFDHLTDIDLLALLIECEAGNQRLIGKVAVACVPYTRLGLRPWRYGHTIRDVMLKPWQFSCFNDPQWSMRFWPVSNESMLVAKLADAKLLDSPTKLATHYYNPKLASPNWAKLFQPIAVIDDHVFMREQH